MRFKPLVDRLFYIISIPTAAVALGATVLGIWAPSALFIMLPVDILIGYFLISPLFGYVELRDGVMFIKYGFILKKEIPYESIRGIKKERRFISESIMSLKNSFEHVNIRYGKFDVTCVSVRDNDTFIAELNARRGK